MGGIFKGAGKNIEFRNNPATDTVIIRETA
jgi:hypothetical protein